METRHYSTIRSSMSYIEKLLNEIESSLNSKENKIYKGVEIDLSKKQIFLIKKQLKKLNKNLAKAKETFNLEYDSIKLSKLIDVNTSYIWETIEDTWSSKIEKMSGKINSEEKGK